MIYDVSPEEIKAAKWPHEVFLINLIFNHILMFIAFLSASSLFHMVVLVPIVSFIILGYTLWRARLSCKRDPWYVMCHWQVAGRRSRLFIVMLLIMVSISTIGLLGHYYLGWMKELVYALIGGAGLLPTMVTVLVLIIMESDALHMAGNGKLPEWVVARYPNDAAVLLE